MTSRARHSWHEERRGAQDHAAPSGSLLDHLRHAAREARCKCYTDLLGACALLSTDREVAREVAPDILMRCLAQALGHRPVLLREGEAERSDDEAWLIALARAVKTGDTASASFLLHSRVPVYQHRNLVFLLKIIVEQFDEV